MTTRRDFLGSAALGGAGFCLISGTVWARALARSEPMVLSESFTPQIWLDAFRASHTGMHSADRAFWQAYSGREPEAATSSDRALRLLTLPAPGVEAFEPAAAHRLVPQLNDRLAEAVKGDPRAMGFAVVSADDPAFLHEAERSISRLGLSGLALGVNRGARLDDRRFWPLYELAQSAGVPLYLPAAYAAVAGDAPYRALDRGGVLTGASADSGAHASQLIFGGVLDAFPQLTVILARMGEGAATRYGQLVANQEHLATSGTGGPRRAVQDYFRQNFFLTTADLESDETVAFLHHMSGKGRVLPTAGSSAASVGAYRNKGLLAESAAVGLRQS